MLKTKENLIWLLLIASVLISCSHSIQTYPPPHEQSIAPDKVESPTIPQVSQQPEQKKEILPIGNIEKNNDSLNESLAEKGADEFISEKVEESNSLGITSHYKVNEYVSKALGKNKSYYIAALNRFEKIRPQIETVLAEEGLPRDLSYVVFVESEGNPKVVSPSGAGGYWQFLPGTAREYGLKIDRWVDERSDLEKSTHAAARYLKYLYNMFGDWLLACAAYNAGEVAIAKLLKKNKDVQSFWDISPEMIYKYETIAFVPKILASIQIGKNRDKYGIPSPINAKCSEFEYVSIDSYMSFERLSEITGRPISVFTALNPELKKKCTPPNIKEYKLKVPKGSGVLIESCLGNDENPAIEYAEYQVQKGDTLFSISMRFGTSPEILSSINKLDNQKKLSVGSLLTIPENIYLKQGEKKTIASKDFRLKKTSDENSRHYNDEGQAYQGTAPKKDGLASISKTNKKPIKITYKVKKGDTLWKISKRFEIKPEDIKRWNQLGTTTRIHPGDRLTIHLKTTD